MKIVLVKLVELEIKALDYPLRAGERVKVKGTDYNMLEMRWKIGFHHSPSLEGVVGQVIEIDKIIIRWSELETCDLFNN